ncbi:nucleopolyhedrovirus P10 family protein [Streptomyces sp. NPDC018964]|uniref:nucleopolyhedrovirus P10 family protein n=1 Tax=unclassified Streptomyces TaxID=2593676 RepID=UPI0037B19C04
MTVDRWTRAVRHQVGLGRILPLGGARDGAWITERAAETVLRRAVVRDVPGVRLDGVRIGLADPGAAARSAEPVVPPPPSALPPGPLRLAVEFAATAAEPVPVTASRLRAVLAEAAVGWVGLAVTSVDLRVTELLDAGSGPGPVAGLVAEPVVEPGREAVAEPSDSGSEAGRVAVVARAVPGVSRLAGALGRSVHLVERSGENALSRRHVRVELAVAADARPLDVARGVRSAVASALSGGPTVAVLITAVD